MNITFVCNEYPPCSQGGIGTFVYTFGHALQAKGHSITVVGLGPTNKQWNDDGVRVVLLASTLGNSLTNDRETLNTWLENDVRTAKTDIIEVPDFEGMMPYNFAGCPIVVRLHMAASCVSVSAHRPPRPLVYYFERQTLRNHGHWIPVSQFVLNYTQKVFQLTASSASVVYNCVPPSPQATIHDTTPLTEQYGDFILYVGKICRHKGALDLARAANWFLAEFPSIRLVYIGRDTTVRGKSVTQAIYQIVDQGVRDRVLFIGNLPHREVLRWMTAAKVLVQPSHLESFGLVIIEAAQAGVPVVYTRSAAGPEVIEHNRTGLLVCPTRPREISQAVQQLLLNPQWATQLAANAKAVLAKRFSVEACINASLTIYKDIIALHEANNDYKQVSNQMSVVSALCLNAAVCVDSTLAEQGCIQLGTLEALTGTRIRQATFA
jgi:glycosyltransferase involved in cell wall biosynthesis